MEPYAFYAADTFDARFANGRADSTRAPPFGALPRPASRGVGNSKPFKMVAIDLDGTTVLDQKGDELQWEAHGDEPMSSGTIEAALAYQKAGGHLVIATGRPYNGAKDVAAQLQNEKHTGLMVCGNGATVHDLKSADPSVNIALRETLRADTISTLYRILVKHNPDQQFGICTGKNEYMYNAPKAEGLLKFTRAAMDDKTYAYTSTFTYNHTAGVDNYCKFLDENVPQSLVSPDSIFTWCFGLKKEQLTEVLQPCYEEFQQATGQRVQS